MKIYCIYDRKAELMNPPFVQPNNAMALRQFQIMVNQPSTPERTNVIHDYHEDFVGKKRTICHQIHQDT